MFWRIGVGRGQAWGTKPIYRESCHYWLRPLTSSMSACAAMHAQHFDLIAAHCTKAINRMQEHIVHVKIVQHIDPLLSCRIVCLGLILIWLINSSFPCSEACGYVLSIISVCPCHTPTATESCAAVPRPCMLKWVLYWLCSMLKFVQQPEVFFH